MKRFNLPAHKQPKPKGQQRLDGLVRLMRSLYQKNKKPDKLLAVLKKLFPFVPKKVFDEIARRDIVALRDADNQLRDPNHPLQDEISVKNLSIIRAFQTKEKLRNIAATILQHERRRNN